MKLYLFMDYLWSLHRIKERYCIRTRRTWSVEDFWKMFYQQFQHLYCVTHKTQFEGPSNSSSSPSFPLSSTSYQGVLRNHFHNSTAYSSSFGCHRRVRAESPVWSSPSELHSRDHHHKCHWSCSVCCPDHPGGSARRLCMPQEELLFAAAAGQEDWTGICR